MRNTMARSGIRSSALARAEAQLSGQRVPMKSKDSKDELQEYMRALSSKTSALKLAQPSIANLSDLSASEQESEKYKGTVGPQQSTGTQSRFLKKKNPASKDTQSNVKPASVVAKPQPMQSKMPTSAALKRLAEFENRHRMRKVELDISENDSDLRTSEERPFSNRSSSELSFRGNRFLKKKVNIKEPEPVEQIRTPSVRGSSADKRQVAESEEEEMLQLVGSSVEFSEADEKWLKMPKPPRSPSPPSRLTPRRNLHRSPSALGYFSPRRPPSRFSSRTPSPPSYGTPRYPRRTHSLIRFGSRSPSPSVRSSLTSNSPRPRLGRRSRTPLSQRSNFKSLDELFSRADDLSSSSSNDFKLNILSLDELAPAAGTEELEEKIRISSLPMKSANEKPKERKQAPITDHREPSHRHKDAKTFMRQKSSSDEESAPEVHTETNKSDVSKHRHKDSSSSEQYSQERPDETTIHSAYSEDFEDSVPSDNELRSSSYSYSLPKSISSDSSLSSSHSYPQPSQSKRKEQSHITHRLVLRETSVQTNDAEFAYSWPQATIGFGPLAPSIAVEPASVVSHVVSPELIEALTTYNPMALALNDMLKQQLLLTRGFVDMARQLYLSTVKSLESESYQYTTLEDTKKYIKQHKSHKWRDEQREEINRIGDHKQSSGECGSN
ncbi:uncharacterized protein C19orf44 homolog isoform X2 [Rana temporaria]|uniref:uncharacterized protein C19orf44 homolog isoform X2 n=1 Tax=Rana temporaria TaxID=8407 RepID=UPI001AACFCCC|nr:uncharacterized protein C19orf44 homolog isoform X2 [Rana temporaria]